MDGVKSMRLQARVLTVVVAVGCVAGCSASSPPPVTPPASTAPPATSAAPSPQDLAGEEALAAYRGMWADFVSAAATSDWQSPSLGRHATGVALTNLSRGLYADSVNGFVTRGDPVLSPAVSSAEPASAPSRVIVTDCGDSSASLKYKKSDGSPVGAGSGGRRLINAVVALQSDGSWKVSDFGVQDIGSC
ncbi:hypothetical protein [Pseudonocardia sp.]|uniref:hypothetical protein n=1 Tax=Pseudonocardia sp. TaxID=60912 RepID=UPI0025E04826|nr:hypothetical protein [Pseudonocardia sp.]